MCYDGGMETIAVRELRNQVSRVMADVESGESFIVSVSGRPVGVLSPIGRRPTSMPTPVAFELLGRAAADALLREELAATLPDTTDDL